MSIYFKWFFKCVLNESCLKSDNEEARIIMLALFWFPEFWFGLVMSTYKFSSLVDQTTHSHYQMGCWDYVIWHYPDFHFVEREWVPGCSIRRLEHSRYVWGNLHFVLALSDITLPEVCQGWTSGLVLCLLNYLQCSTYCQIVSP